MEGCDVATSVLDKTQGLEASAKLIDQLPLPLSQLYRRARNAKSCHDRHQNAYLLAEASLKLATAARVGILVTNGWDHRSRLANLITRLCRGSLEDWVEVWRAVTQELSRRADVALLPLGESHAAISQSVESLAMKEFLCRFNSLDPALPAATSVESPSGVDEPLLSDFFASLPEYRRRFLAEPECSAALDQELGDLLRTALQDLLSHKSLFGDLTLAMARRLPPELDPQQEIVEWQGLRGMSSLLIERNSLGTEPSVRNPNDRAQSGHLYFVGRGVRIPLHPLVIYSEDRTEREHVGFLGLNAVRKHARGVTNDRPKIAYVDYTSGENLNDVDASQELRPWLSRINGPEFNFAELPMDDADSSATAEDIAEPSAKEGRPTLGDFELAEELSRTAMSVVYRAWQRPLGRWVALKVLTPALAADSVALARFRREIAALARCDHPHLVKILTAGSEADRHYYAMELVQGRTLLELFQTQQELPKPSRNSSVAEPTSSIAPASHSGLSNYPQLSLLFADAADALQHLHARGILHRDLWPANVMLADEGRLVLMDLGLAKLRDGSQNLTSTHARWLGTLRYCAPEQLQSGILGVDERADIYSFGAVLYELTTLTRLFDTDDEAQLIELILERNPVFPQRLNTKIPADLCAIITKCLAKDRTQRYESAAQLSEDLRRFARGDAVSVRPDRWTIRAGKWVLQHRLAATSLAVFGATSLMVTALSLRTAWNSNVLNADLNQRVDHLERDIRQAQTSQTLLEQQLTEAKSRFEDESTARMSVERLSEFSLAHVERDCERLGWLTRETISLQDFRTIKLLRESLFGPSNHWRELSANLTDESVHRVSVALARALTNVGEELGQRAEGLVNPASNQTHCLDDAATIWKALVAAHPEFDEYRAMLAATYSDLSVLQTRSGQTQAALQLLDKALSLCQQLVADHPNDSEHLTRLAKIHNNRGLAFRFQGDIVKAKGEYEAALAARERSIVNEPASALRQLAQLDVAGYRLNLSDYYRGSDQIPKAVELLRTNAAMLDQLNENEDFDFGDLEEFRRVFAMTHSSLSLLLREDLEFALASVQKALPVARQLATESESLEDILLLVRCCRNLGMLNLAKEDFAVVEETAREILALGEQWQEELSNSPEAQMELGNTCFMQGMIDADKRRDFTSAKKWSELAVTHFERARELLPNLKDSQFVYAAAHALRGRALAELERYAESLDSFDRAFALSDQKSRHLWRPWRAIGLAGTGDYARALVEAKIAGGFQMVEVYALAIAAAQRDSKLSPAERQQRAQRYTGEALKLVQQLKQAGVFDDADRRMDFLRSPHLKSLREHPEIIKLTRELQPDN